MSGSNGHANGKLDMTKAQDRVTLRGALTRGWQVDPKKLGAYMKALDVALGLALEKESPREIRGCVDLMRAIVQQCVEDERKDAGEADSRVEVVFQDAQPRWVRT